MSYLSSVVCFCVFFFKQKTAYEMRISDWSSDVCSSDLDLGCSDRRQEAVDLLAQRGRLARQLFGGRQHLAGRRAGLAGRGLHPGDVGGEIGRASCRERVGQYV